MGDVYRLLHFNDTLICQEHGFALDLDPTEERRTEIATDLRVLTDQDLTNPNVKFRCQLAVDADNDKRGVKGAHKPACTKVVSFQAGISRDLEVRAGAKPLLTNLVGITDQGCKVIPVFFDVAKFVQYLETHAGEGSQSACFKVVKQAIQAGGYKGFGNNIVPAETADQLMEHTGFQRVGGGTGNDTGAYTPADGDVAVFKHVPNHVHGHIAGKTRTKWMSDYKQPAMAPSVYANGEVTIYRYTPPNDRVFAGPLGAAAAAPKK